MRTYLPTTLTWLRQELKNKDKYFTRKVIDEILEKRINPKQAKYYQNKRKVKILQAILLNK